MRNVRSHLLLKRCAASAAYAAIAVLSSMEQSPNAWIGEKITGVASVSDTGMGELLKARYVADPQVLKRWEECLKEGLEGVVCKFEYLCQDVLQHALAHVEYAAMPPVFAEACNQVEFKYATYMQYPEEGRAKYESRIDAALQPMEAAMDEHFPGFMQVRGLYEMVEQQDLEQVD